LHFGGHAHVDDAVARGDDADDDPDERAAKLIRHKSDHGSVDAVLDDLSNEADALYDVLRADDSNCCLVDECAEAGGNEGGRLVASVCSRLKDDVLNNMRSYFISKKFKVVKVLSEGVAVEILGDRVVNDAVLRDCETTIFQTTGATLRLEETPMPAERRVDPGSVSAKQAPFGFLIQTLATEASGRGLTRMGKHVFETHPRISGALVRGQQHLTFINQTLRADPVYQKGNYASTLGAWFEKQDDERFPMLEPDDVSRTTIAFQDGWLDAATGYWYPRDDAERACTERGEAEVPKKPATTFHFLTSAPPSTWAPQPRCGTH